MSTPDNRSVNFFSLFRRGSITQRRGRWKNALPRSLSKTRYQDDALCDPFYAADRRIYLCWQIALGGQLGPAVATALLP